jgi:hypothetical protein
VSGVGRSPRPCGFCPSTAVPVGEWEPSQRRVKPTRSYGGPRVRIHLPPAASLVRTRPKASATASSHRAILMMALSVSFSRNWRERWTEASDRKRRISGSDFTQARRAEQSGSGIGVPRDGAGPAATHELPRCAMGKSSLGLLGGKHRVPRKSGSQRTLRRRELDSNPRSLAKSRESRHVDILQILAGRLSGYPTVGLAGMLGSALS